MKALATLTAFLVFLTGTLASCEKGVLKQNITLKDKPLAEIKRNLQGQWQLHYERGGISGDYKYVYHNSFIDFRPDDSLYWTVDGEEWANTKIDWKWGRDQFHDSTYIMRFSDVWGYPISWGIKGIQEDTLVLYDIGADGMSDYLTKKK